MPTFQVLFSSRTPEAIALDGILHDEAGEARAVTIVGARMRGSMLDLIIPATLDTWADEGAVVSLRDVGGSLELSSESTKVRLHPADARA